MNVQSLNKMPVKKYDYENVSYYSCRCRCGVYFFGEKKDYECPLCGYHRRKREAKK